MPRAWISASRFAPGSGHTGPLRPSEIGRPIPYIDQVALDFPELTIVCGHIGYPWTTEMISVAEKHLGLADDTRALFLAGNATRVFRL
jgi:predicted TIM-barrel fold metal-dependent hydrolase